MNSLKFLGPVFIGLCLLSMRPIPVLADEMNCPKPHDDGIHWGLAPISNYTSDRGLTLGVLSRRFDYRSTCAAPFRSVLTLEASYATRGARIFEIAYEATELTPLNLRSASIISFTQNDYQPYYGIGDGSVYHTALDAQDFYRYTQKEFLVENSLRKRLDQSILEPQVGISLARSSFTPSKAISQFTTDFGDGNENLFATRLFARSVWEGRDSEFTPSSGQYGLIGITHSPSFLGNYSESWTRWDGDYRIYFPLVPERKLWLAHQIRYTGVTESTPLSEKARLGSVGTLRGLPFSRYLGNHSASFRSDIRSIWFQAEVFGLPFKLGNGVFFDYGRLGNTLADIPRARGHHSWGFSIIGSYFTDDFLGSADFGFSEGSTIFYVRLGHAF